MTDDNSEGDGFILIKVYTVAMSTMVAKNCIVGDYPILGSWSGHCKNINTLSRLTRSFKANRSTTPSRLSSA